MGTIDGVYDAGDLKFAPLICWESAFADLAHAQLRNGAQILVIATDDAWFGETAGPYQHAQIAQLRAIEAGAWVVRAASTGVSGIISPDGRYIESTGLDREAVVLGAVGLPPGSLFARIGPNTVILVCVLLYVGLLAWGMRRRAA
jgi:apolipoprotein N-acyltransferase